MAERRGSGSSGNDDVIGLIFGLLVAVGVLYAGWSWLQPRLPGLGAWLLAGLAELWRVGWFPLCGIALALLAGAVGRVWLQRRGRQRGQQVELLAAALRPVMPKDWEPARQLQVRRWSGRSPKMVRLHLTATCPDADLEWRRLLVAAAQLRMGDLGPVRWPERAARRRQVDLEVRASANPPAQGDIPPAGKVELERALAGLVPAAAVEVLQQEGREQVLIDYGETTRDQSPQWRARVVEQVAARTGRRWRGQWDRQRRRLTLVPVPELPALIERQLAYAAFAGVTSTPWVIPYGVDEDGFTVCWELATQPHAMAVGETGSGKTECAKSIAMGFLEQGGLVILLDPKKKDFASFLGKPGVLCVATTVEDRVAALLDVHELLMRRTAAYAVRELLQQNPELAAEVTLPAVSAVDLVPVLVLVDETTQNNADMQAWWSGLSKEQKKEYGAETARTPPMLRLPAQIAQLARAVRIHLLLGMQRADADNFGGDSTQMRDNIALVISQGQTSAIGSEMVWGDRSTGSTVEIASRGEGVSNGLRVDLDGQRARDRQPGRYKAFYAGEEAHGDTYWQRVAAVAPDASLIPLARVSDAARNPRAAMEALLELAYGGVLQVERTSDAEQAWSPAASRDVITAVSPSEQSAPPAAPTAASGGAALPTSETDTRGRNWAPVRVSELAVGDTVTLGDIAEAEVVDVTGWVEDELTGDEVFRIVLAEAGEESVVDLGDEVIQRVAEVSN